MMYTNPATFPSACSFILFYLLQLQCGNVFCAKKSVVFVFTDHYQQGNHTALDISKCSNLPTKLIGQVTAVDTNGLCVQFYAGKDCSGKSIEMLPRSPSHHNLADWGFNDMTMSAGPCRDPCSLDVTGPLPPKAGLNVSVFDRKSYQGATQLITVIGCTVIPRKFNYRVFSINTTFTDNCFQLYNNVECKSNLRMGLDSIELRSGTPFHDDISRWLIPQVKAISHCSFKCNKIQVQPKTSNTSSPTNITESVMKTNEGLAQKENQVILYDEPKFTGNPLSVDISDTNCINLDHFSGWEGATRSIQLYKNNNSCVMLYTALNCTGDRNLQLTSPLDNMFAKNFSDVTRSLRSCGTVGEVASRSKVSKGSYRWVTVMGLLACFMVGVFFLLFIVGKWWYPNMKIGSVFQICKGSQTGGSTWGSMRL